MKKHLNLKKYVNLKKTVLIFSGLMVLFLIIGSSIAMADIGFSEQNKSLDVKKSVVNQIAGSPKSGLAPENPEFIEYRKKTFSTQKGLSLDGHKPGLIPTVVDLHHLSNIPSAGLSARLTMTCGL
jgi:hypothetical protein